MHYLEIKEFKAAWHFCDHRRWSFSDSTACDDNRKPQRDANCSAHKSCTAVSDGAVQTPHASKVLPDCTHDTHTNRAASKHRMNVLG